MLLKNESIRNRIIPRTFFLANENLFAAYILAITPLPPSVSAPISVIPTFPALKLANLSSRQTVFQNSLNVTHRNGLSLL